MLVKQILLISNCFKQTRILKLRKLGQYLPIHSGDMNTMISNIVKQTEIKNQMRPNSREFFK